MAIVASDISGISAELTGLGGGPTVATGTALGTAAGDAMIASRANDGSTAANLQTLTPYVPANEGQPGVYVPPAGRPAMTPTWGTVAPFGMSSGDAPGAGSDGSPAAAAHLAGLCAAGVADRMRGVGDGAAVGDRSGMRGERLPAGIVRGGGRRAVLERSRRHVSAPRTLAADRRHRRGQPGARSAATRARGRPGGGGAG